MNRAVEDYLAELESRGYSHSRLKHLRYTLELLMLFLKESHRITDWRQVTEKHLRGFGVFAATRHRTPKGLPVSTGTLRQWLSGVRGFFRWMRKSGRLVYDPSEQLALPRRGQEIPRVLSEREIGCLIETPDINTSIGVRDRALMETLYATGIRRGEAHRLNLYDVDTTARWLLVRLGKGRRDRLVPLTQTACRWLTRYISEARPELVSGYKGSARPKSPTSALWVSKRGRRMSDPMMAQRIREYARQAKVRASIHTFRHSCATHLLRGGASVRHVQQLLGHQGLETTEIYTHVEIEDLKRVVEHAQAESFHSPPTEAERIE